MFGLAFAGALPPFKTPNPLLKRYAPLLRELVTEHDRGERRLGSGRHWARQGLDVIYVRGDRFEMAYQHGALLRDKIARGSLTHASQIAEHGIKNSVGDGLLSKALVWYQRRGIAERMLRHALSLVEDDPDLHLAEAYGLSEGSGVPVKTILNAALGPESAQVLFGMTANGLQVGGPGVNQCTSFAAWGAATADGDMLIGRNTDYPLNGYFDANPTVIYFDPTDGSKKYMTVASAGFHNAGVCGLNESGIYLAVHTVLTQHVSPRGTPIFMIGQEVLRKASTFDEALEMLEKQRPAAGWSYHLVSTRENRVATLEMSNSGVGLRESTGDVHVTTNHWSEATMMERYLDLNRTVDDDTRSRRARAEDMLAELRGQIVPQNAAAILGDKYDRVTERVRSQPNTIAANQTVSSSIWRPNQGFMYAANGLAPVSHNEYVKLPTVDVFDPDAFGASEVESFDNSRFKREHSEKAEAERLFIEAKASLEYDNDCETALPLLRQVVEKDSDPAFLYLLGAVAAKTGRFGEAVGAMDGVLDLAFDGPRCALALYHKGRIAAHRGEKKLAKTLLTQSIDHPDANDRLRTVARKVNRKLRLRRRVALRPSDVALMVFLPDAYGYESASPL
jgi:predicted choloylglycine hydrolase